MEETGFSEEEIRGRPKSPRLESSLPTSKDGLPDMTLKYRANELLAKIDSTLRDALSSFAKDATSLGANKGGGTESDGGVDKPLCFPLSCRLSHPFSPSPHLSSAADCIHTAND